MPRAACSLATAAYFITAASSCCLAASWAWTSALAAVVHTAFLAVARSTLASARAKASVASADNTGLRLFSAAHTPYPSPPTTNPLLTSLPYAIRREFIFSSCQLPGRQHSAAHARYFLKTDDLSGRPLLRYEWKYSRLLYSSPPISMGTARTS